MLNKLIKGIALYPLAFYLGIIAGFFALLFTALSIKIGAQLALSQISSYMGSNTGEFLLFSGVVFVLLFAASSYANKTLHNVSPTEYKMWLEQKATRTFFPFFIPLHDKLRLRLKLYRRWHTNLFTSSLHFLLLIIFSLIAISNITTQNGQFLLADILDVEPPAEAPIMNSPSDITNNSIRWNLTDNTTNEDDHTFQRTDHFIVGTVPSTTKITTGTAYSFNETGLSPNTSYTRHAHAANSLGESPASSSAIAVTLANTPGTPTIPSVGATTITVLIDVNGNPSSTEFAIQETSTGKFVQGSGTLSASIVWSTYASWGGASGKITTGLSINTRYTFRLKARNSNNIETSYSASSTKITLAKVPISPTLTVIDTKSIGIKINGNGNPSSVKYAIFNQTLGKYIHKNGKLNNNPQWNTRSAFGGDSGVINGGLSEKTDYTYKVKARNSDNIETVYSVSSTINTGSPSGSSSGGEDPDPPPGGGGEQLTVVIDILEVDPETGDYQVNVNSTVEGKLLLGNLTGSLGKSSISGNFNGGFTDILVTGVFTGLVSDSKLSEASMVLTGKDDTSYSETLLVAGIVSNKANSSGVVEQIIDSVADTSVDDPLGNANVVVTGLALATAATAIPALTSSIVTQAISAFANSFQWFFFGYIPKRRRRVWGRVLNSQTHMPVAGVKVRLLINLTDYQVVSSLMTDKTGRYGFVVDRAGNYVVSIHNPLYYDYQSELINITDPKKEILGKDLYIKPNEEEYGKKIIKIAKLMEFFKAMVYLHWPLLIGGTVLSLYLEVQSHTPLRLGIVILYGLLWIFEVGQLVRKHSYGTVVSKDSNEGQKHAVVQLTKNKDGVSSIASTTITDKHGRFFFVVKKADYDLSATKTGFVPKVIKFNGETPDTRVELQALGESQPKG